MLLVAKAPGAVSSSRRLMRWFGPVALMVLCKAANAEDASNAKITYDEHVRPLFREYCLACHNATDKKGDLALDTYDNLMAGGGSGSVVEPNDLRGSRLWALVAHEEEPKMPPNQDRLASAKLDLIKRWILAGAPRHSGSVGKVVAPVATNFIAPNVVSRPQGPAAMPEGLSRQPVTHSKRAGAVTALAASPWAPLAAVAGQKQILLYHTDTAELLGVLPFSEGIPYVLKFSRNGALLVAGGGRNASRGKVVIFDIKTGRRVIEVGDELDVVLCADIDSTHTQIALGGPGKVVRVFSAKDGSLLREFKKHTDWLYAIEYSPDGRLLASADRSNGLFVWEAATGREYQNLQGHTAAVTDVSWRSDARVLASTSQDGTVRLWDMENGRETGKWSAHAEGVEAIEFALDARLCSTGRDRAVKLWGADGKLLQNLSGLADFGLEVMIDHRSRRVFAGDVSGQVYAWDINGGTGSAVMSPSPPK